MYGSAQKGNVRSHPLLRQGMVGKGYFGMKKFLFLTVALLLVLLAAGCTEQGGEVSTDVSSADSAESSGESFAESEASPEESSDPGEISIDWPSEDESDPESAPPESSEEESSLAESSVEESSEISVDDSIFRDESEPKLEDIVISPIEEKEFVFKQTEMMTLLGGKVEVPYEFTPVGTTNRTLIWESSDHTVIRVEEDGSLTAVSLGVATVTATTPKGNKATCKVEVVEEIPMSPLATLVYNKTQGSFTGWVFALQDVDLDGTPELLARVHGEDGLPLIYVMDAATGEEQYSFKTGVDEEWAVWKRKDGSSFILVSYTQNLQGGVTAYAMDELTASAEGKPVRSPVLYRKTNGEYNARVDGFLVKCDKNAYNAVRNAFFADNTQTEEITVRWVGGMDAESIATALQSEK